jgi:hypothetical protein
LSPYTQAIRRTSPPRAKGPAFHKVAENLHRLQSTGGYYALLKQSGKQIRRSLKTTDRTLAKRRLEELRRKVAKLQVNPEVSSHQAKAGSFSGTVPIVGLNDPGGGPRKDVPKGPFARDYDFQVGHESTIGNPGLPEWICVLENLVLTNATEGGRDYLQGVYTLLARMWKSGSTSVIDHY